MHDLADGLRLRPPALMPGEHLRLEVGLRLAGLLARELRLQVVEEEEEVALAGDVDPKSGRRWFLSDASGFERIPDESDNRADTGAGGTP